MTAAALNAHDHARRLRYQLALDGLDVEHNPRYQPNQRGEGETYCNLFVADATASLGAPIPLYVLDEAGAKRWLDVEAMLRWLRQHPDRWHAVPAGEAQRLANRGVPVVAVWSNPSGIGHMAMVRPGPEPLAGRGPRIAQAGAASASDTDAAAGFGGEARLRELVYFAAVLGEA